MEKRKNMEVMTPNHERWDKFVEELIWRLNFLSVREDGGNDWKNCNARENKPTARRILKEMGGFDIPASFAYFEANGGFCDCEILWNIYIPVEDGSFVESEACR
jgi:hypothetical protein